jgi:adenosylcobinamide-GDP ribazoletransferase
MRIDETVVSVIVVFLSVAITRMLHLDGLADTFDGLLGGRDCDHALSIMKDSRVGSFGAVALACTIIAKIVFLADLDVATIIKALVLFPIVGRWAACYAMITQPYARLDGLGALFSKGRKNSELIIPSLITVVVAIMLLKITGLIALVGIWVFTVAFLKWVRGKIGGITGDIVGALIEMSEVLAIFLLVVEKQLL